MNRFTINLFEDMWHQSPRSSSTLLAIDNLRRIKLSLEMNEDSCKRQNTGLGADDVEGLRVPATIIRPVDDILK